MLDIQAYDKFKLTIVADSEAKKHLSAIADYIKSQVLKRTPKKTGMLQKSVIKKQIPEGYEITFNNDKANKVAVFQHYGTVAHWIFPVKAKALSWIEDGTRYFSKGHKVSGVKAKRFFELKASDINGVRQLINKFRLIR